MKSFNVTYERITAVGLLAVSLAYTILGLRYKLGHLANPGSGLMPMVVGFLLTGCAAVYLFKTFRSGFKTLDHTRGQGAGRCECVATAGCEHFERPATPPSGVRRGYETTSEQKPGESQQGKREEGWWGRNLIPVCIAVLVFVYPFLLKRVDFIIATILTVWAILVLLRYKSVLIAGMIAIAISVSLFCIFSMLLNVPLPSGEVEALILNLW